MIKTFKIITGITVEEQMKKAQLILKTKVIPRSKAYQMKKRYDVLNHKKI